MYRNADSDPSFVVTAFNGHVVLLDAGTGSERWRARIASVASGSVRVQLREHDVIALCGGTIVALTLADGSERWRAELGGHPHSSMLCVGERAFVSSLGALTCVDLAQGQILWRNELPGTGYGHAAIAVPGGAVQADIA